MREEDSNEGSQNSGSEPAPAPAPAPEPPLMPPDPYEKAISTTRPPRLERPGHPGQRTRRRE